MDKCRILSDKYEEYLSILLYKNIIIDLCKYVKNTFTPNTITSVNVIVRIIIICIIRKSKKYTCIIGILLFISLVLDYMDGCIARVTNSATAFGDLYDHISDCIFYLLFTYFCTSLISFHKHVIK